MLNLALNKILKNTFKVNDWGYLSYKNKSLDVKELLKVNKLRKIYKIPTIKYRLAFVCCVKSKLISKFLVKVILNNELVKKYERTIIVDLNRDLV